MDTTVLELEDVVRSAIEPLAQEPDGMISEVESSDEGILIRLRGEEKWYLLGLKDVTSWMLTCPIDR